MTSWATRVGNLIAELQITRIWGTKGIYLGNLPHVNNDRAHQDPHLR